MIRTKDAEPRKQTVSEGTTGLQDGLPGLIGRIVHFTKSSLDRKQVKPASLGCGLGRREAFEGTVTKRRAKGMRKSVGFIYFFKFLYSINGVPVWKTWVMV